MMVYSARVLGICGLVLWLSGCRPHSDSPQVTNEAASGEPAAVSAPAAQLEKVAVAHLPNAWRLNSKVISGGQPEGPAAFQELKDLGIKTIISVDGAQPDVDLARQFGMRYVHLPHGYDGVPKERAKSLAKAVRDLAGPIYIHCHHGKHRSPTAAVVACVGSGLMMPEMGLTVLKSAGTGENYRGLYQSASDATRFDDAMLDALQVEFRESVELPPIADAMVKMEHSFDELKQLDQANWSVAAESADADPVHQALLLRECYTELLRSNDLSQQPEGFIELVAQCEGQAKDLEEALLQWKRNQFRSPVPEKVKMSFGTVAASCIVCHKRFRDVPLNEKPVAK